jgi:hypothetical protein
MTVLIYGFVAVNIQIIFFYCKLFFSLVTKKYFQLKIYEIFINNLTRCGHCSYVFFV